MSAKVAFLFRKLGVVGGLGSFCFAEGSACVSGQNKMCQWRRENYFLKCAVGKIFKTFRVGLCVGQIKVCFVGLQRKRLSIFIGTFEVSTVVLRLQPTAGNTR